MTDISATMRPDTPFVRNPKVIHSHSGEAVLALDVQSGDCFSFGGPSARLWELLEQPISAADAAGELVKEFDIETETCRREILDYFGKLHAEGLIRTAAAAA